MSRMPGAVRELYAEALEEAREAMYADGLTFADEMRTLVLAWLHTRRALGGPAIAAEPIYAEPGELDHENPSPANILLHHARNTPPGRLAGITLPRPAEPRPLNAEDLRPVSAEQWKPKPRRSQGRPPSDKSIELNRKLLAVLRGDLEDLRIAPGILSFPALRCRCSVVGRECRTHRLRARIQDDGTMLIHRRARSTE